MSGTEKLIGWDDLSAMLGGLLSRDTVARLEREGKFPKRRQLSTQKIGWLRSEVEQWLQELPVAEGEDSQPREGQCGTDTEN